MSGEASDGSIGIGDGRSGALAEASGSWAFFFSQSRQNCRPSETGNPHPWHLPRWATALRREVETSVSGCVGLESSPCLFTFRFDGSTTESSVSTKTVLSILVGPEWVGVPSKPTSIISGSEEAPGLGGGAGSFPELPSAGWL